MRLLGNLCPKLLVRNAMLESSTKASDVTDQSEVLRLLGRIDVTGLVAVLQKLLKLLKKNKGNLLAGILTCLPEIVAVFR